MLNYVCQFFKTLNYPGNKVGDPQFFFVFLTQVTHYLTAVKILKLPINWKMFTQTSLKGSLKSFQTGAPNT